MKRSIFTHISAFLSGLSIGFVLCTFVPFKASTIEEQNTNTVSVAISNIETNRATSTSQNVDWFKDNSNYIWDGWKIK